MAEFGPKAQSLMDALQLLEQSGPPDWTPDLVVCVAGWLRTELAALVVGTRRLEADLGVDQSIAEDHMVDNPITMFAWGVAEVLLR